MKVVQSSSKGNKDLIKSTLSPQNLFINKSLERLRDHEAMETELSQERTSCRDGVSSDDKRGDEEVERIEQNSMAIEKERGALQRELIRLKEEMSALKNERSQEEQRRLINESGVPKVSHNLLIKLWFFIEILFLMTAASNMLNRHSHFIRVFSLLKSLFELL